MCGAIFKAAGAAKLQSACDEIGYCAVGDAVITPGFDLPAAYIIHTVGPVWQGGGHDEQVLLRSCYSNSLALAAQNGCRSVSFPLISAGIFGYPKDQAQAVAADAIEAFLEESELTVYLVLYDG